MIERGCDLPEKVIIFNQNQDPEFFEVFLPNRIPHQLQIPPDFIKHFDEKIPDAVMLKDLSGSVWHVDIKQEKTGVFFKNGWNKFVNEKSLVLGQFVVFRYSRKSKSFSVRIFGRNACKDEDQESGKLFNSVKDEQEFDQDLTPIREPKRTCRKP